MYPFLEMTSPLNRPFKLVEEHSNNNLRYKLEPARCLPTVFFMTRGLTTIMLYSFATEFYVREQ